MSAEIPCAASECIMPTWMAPKLPPPANTKAVLAALVAGATESDTDKAPAAPSLGALAESHAAFGEVYSSGSVRRNTTHDRHARASGARARNPYSANGFR